MAKRAVFKPFRHLKKLLQEHNVQVETLPAVRIPPPDLGVGTAQQDDRLFRQAMEGVQPLSRRNTAPSAPRRPSKGSGMSEDEAVLCRLRRLVDSGHGFRVADTPEYIEGKDAAVPEELTRRLHAGAFAIQAHIDLHGLRVAEARQAVDRLLARATREGLRTVLIVHGRGLSSPVEPVLKSHLRRWLERGSWRKWVLAYTSARVCDGGAGATYVLLRRRPVPKRRAVRKA